MKISSANDEWFEVNQFLFTDDAIQEVEERSWVDLPVAVAGLRDGLS